MEAHITMTEKVIYMRDDIGIAMSNYNKAHGRHFITIDSFVMCVILSDAYTTDHELAKLSMSSLSTVKRSINRLCDFGLIKKHISNINQKTLTVNQSSFDSFINSYFNAEPYRSAYLALESSVANG
jgi:hypothetical protein